MVLERLNELPKGAWIALMIFGFWFWWPIGLATLAYMAFGRDRLGCGPGRWHSAPPEQAGVWNQGGWAGWGCRSRRVPAAPTPSGNRAFDEYRAETLRRLEEEQKEFLAYLEKLRQARDKSEFDAFMAERRSMQAPKPSTDDI